LPGTCPQRARPGRLASLPGIARFSRGGKIPNSSSPRFHTGLSYGVNDEVPNLPEKGHHYLHFQPAANDGIPIADLSI
jgi:hypothetical protein